MKIHHLLGSLFLLPTFLYAEVNQESTWKAHNQQVAEFPRGHADVLKWEQANPEKAPKMTGHAEMMKPTLPISRFPEAVDLAWNSHPDLKTSLSQLGELHRSLIQEGHFAQLPIAKISKIPEIAEVIEIAYQTRKQALTLTGQIQNAALQAHMLTASQAAAELSSRMAKVGNWSAYQDTSYQVALGADKQVHLSTQYEIKKSQMELLKQFKQWNVINQPALKLTVTLPALPSKTITHHIFHERLLEVSKQLPLSEQIQLTANAELIYDAYQTAYLLAQESQQQAKRQSFLYEETILRYNGMLMNTWDVLSASRTKFQSEIASNNALRDFWLADADLQLLMVGYIPSSLMTFSASGLDSSSSAGH